MRPHFPRLASLFPLPPSLLMEIARCMNDLLHLELAKIQTDDVPHSTIALEPSLYRHEGREPHHLGIFLDHFLGDDHVDEPELVFHQQEYRTLSALRLLADGDEASRHD